MVFDNPYVRELEHATQEISRAWPRLMQTTYAYIQGTLSEKDLCRAIARYQQAVTALTAQAESGLAGLKETANAEASDPARAKQRALAADVMGMIGEPY